VSSPSQTASATSDATGHFSFVSLAPDTYSISANKAGYEPVSVSGITVTADNTQTVTLKTQRTVRTLGKVTTRAAGELLKPGITADVYSVSAPVQTAAAALGGGGGLNNAYSAVASVPGVFVPQGQNGAYQSIFVRGGNYTQVGYEYDGVPLQRSFDQYPGTNLSSLGQQELQVYTGAAPVNSDSTALAGFINQVIKTGTYPGFGTLKLGVGAPIPYDQASLEVGGATPNRNFSYYVGVAGYNQHIKLEKDHEFDAAYGGVINILRANCTSANPTAGCYLNTAGPGGLTLAPTGYEIGPLFWSSRNLLVDRDNVVNLHFGLPHRRDSGKDDVQLLYNSSWLETVFPATLSKFDRFAGDVQNGTITLPNGTVVPNCARAAAGAPCAVIGSQTPSYFDKQVYNGPTGVALGAGDLANTADYYFPSSPTNRPFNSPINPFALGDTYQQNAAIVKLQYQHNISSSAFLRLFGYTAYSDWLQYGPGGMAPAFYGSVSPDYKLGTHERGLVANFTDQISPKHLVNVNASYTTATTFRNNNSVTLSSSTVAANSSTVAFLVNSANPTNGQCYQVTGAAATPVNCALAASARYILPGAGKGALIRAHATDPTVSAAPALSCGGAPCEYFVVGNGLSAVYNTVTPVFTYVSVQDSWKPNDRLLISLGLRYDDFKYNLVDTTGGPARQFWVNYYNAFNCYDPVTATTSTASAANVCPAGQTPLTFSSKSLSQTDYPVWQPRVGLTYTLNPLNVLRFSWGKYAQPASSAFQQYDTLQPNLVAGTNLLFYTNGFHNPSHLIFPEESYNTDFSWEHQTKGTDLSWKLTPYLRTTKNELTTVLLDPKTNFVSGLNVGQKNVSGLELAIRKGDLERNGFFGQLSYTYTHATIKFTNLPNGQSVAYGLNLAVKQYNAYTSFCASNPTAQCGSISTSTLASPKLAAPCFTAAGAPDPACLPTSVANPYWNAPPQPLFDPNAAYAVYSQFAGSRPLTGSSGSYLVPHVLALVLNYRHDRLNVTPSMQLQAGSVYGRPLDQPGIDPAAGCSALATGTLAGDPRYPYGSPGGRPYNAATCRASIAVPDPYTKQFDNFGAFRQPTKFAGNLQVSYDVSPRVKLSVLGVNVLTSCFGGSKVPWGVGGKAGCVYGSNAFTSNFYNPGDVIDPQFQYPYGPVFGSVFQSTSGGQANPFQAFFTMEFKL
jgi:hypothetical protein